MSLLISPKAVESATPVELVHHVRSKQAACLLLHDMLETHSDVLKMRRDKHPPDPAHNRNCLRKAMKERKKEKKEPKESA